MLIFIVVFPAVQNSFSLGPVSIHWYGLLVVVGIVLGYLVIRYLMFRSVGTRRGASLLDDLIFYLIIWGFIGARLYHVLNEAVYYWNHPIDIFKIWNGGLAIHGAILAGVIVLAKFVIKNFNNETMKQLNGVRSWFHGFMVSWLRVTDVVVVGLALGQSIGRWGNYFNQELFGKPTDGFFKVAIDVANRPEGFEAFEYFHPTFFYESVLNFVLFIILFIAYKRYNSVILNLIQDPETNNKQKKNSFGFLFSFLDSRFRGNDKRGGGNDSKKATSYKLQATGLVTSLYLLGYGLIRFFIDFIRIDPRPFFFGLYLSQWVSLVLVVVGVVIWYTVTRKQLTINS